MALDDPRGAPGDSRAAVLSVLRRAGRPLSAADVAAAHGRHVNTVRAHLDLLVDTGYARRSVERRPTPGRPRVLYEATGRPVAEDTTPTVAANYRILARVLVQQIASKSTPDEYESIGRTAGRTWATATDEILPVAAVADDAEAYVRITELMADLGFDPDPQPERDRVVLHACPYLDGPQELLPIVCGVHHGLLEGSLARMGAGIQATALEPVLDPIRCVVHLARSERPTVDERGR